MCITAGTECQLVFVTELSGLYVQRLQRCLRVVRFNRINQAKASDLNQRCLGEVTTQWVERMRHIHQRTLCTNLLRSVNGVGAKRNLFVQEQPDDFARVCAHFFAHNHATNTVAFKCTLQSHCTIDGVVIGNAQNIDTCFHHRLHDFVERCSGVAREHGVRVHVDTHESIGAWLGQMRVASNCSRSCDSHECLCPTHGDAVDHHTHAHSASRQPVDIATNSHHVLQHVLER